MGSRLSSGDIIGRGYALAAIDRLLADPPGILLLEGEAGIGKSTLVRAAEERAAGFTILHGEAIEFGGDEFAYGPLIAALRERSFPEGAAGQSRMFELVLELLDDAAPVLLVLEDVHWADRSTLAFVAFLARNLNARGIAAIATYRGGGAPAALRRLLPELVRRPSVAALALEPLTEAEVALQLEAIAGEPVPSALAAGLHARSGGNPFFVEELYAAGGVPATVADAVLMRVERLGSRRAVELVAAAGGRLDHALLREPEAVHEAIDAGLLVREPDDRGVAFRHGLIGEVVYERLLPSERTALHRELAAALDAPAAQRAAQFHRAGLHAEAVVASIDAAFEATRGCAYAEADAHFERALALWDPDVPQPLDHAELLARSAQAARFAGDDERAIARCREAIAETVDPRRAALLYERLGEYHYWDDEAALACYEQALRMLPAGPSPERSRVLAAEGHALMGLSRWSEARERCESALDAGAGPRITLAVVLAFLGEFDAGEAYLREALELAETGEDTARAYLHLSELQRIRGDHAAALSTTIEGEAVAARLGLRGSLGGFMYVNAAADLVRLGRWDEAAERLAAAGRMELELTARALLHATAAQLYALRGDSDAAHAALARVPDAVLPAEFVAPLAAARASLALAERDPAGAREHVEAALDAIGDAHDPLYVPELYSLGARAEAALGAASGTRLLERLERVLEPSAPPDALAHRALARAELTGAGWDEAARAFDALGEPYPAAYASLRAAEAALPADRAAAAALLGHVHAAAVALGARPLRDDAETLARRARLVIAEPPLVPVLPAGLTAREIEVLRALAEGLTNREIAERLFISGKTVSAHLAHIFGKLDVHTRFEAAGRAERLGVLQRPS